MEKEELKRKIDRQIELLKETIEKNVPYKRVQEEQRILNELLKQYLQE